MIELNLLPDVKMEYLKAQRTRSLVVSVSILVIIVSVGLLVLLLFFGAVQKKSLSDLNNDIRTDSAKLKEQPGISKVLTVQNQLDSLTRLHDSKPAASRLFEFLNQVTPTNVTISSLLVDFSQQTVTITGGTDSLSSVNKFVDTLKYTKSNNGSSGDKAFSDVVLTSFSINSGSAGGNQASYTISFKYDKGLFDITQKPKLKVPSQSTTRQSIESNNSLFQGGPAPSNGGSN